MTNTPKGLENATRVKAYSFAPEDLTIIGLDTDDGPEHPDYDDRVKLPISEPMVLSILRFGVHQPVNIAVVDGTPIVVDGRQRVRHAREANKRLAEAGETNLVKLQCRTVRTDEAGRALLGVTTNSHRTDDGPVTEAKKAALLTGRGTPDEDICTAFGWSIGTLRNRRKLLELPSQVLQLVESGRLSISAGLTLHGKPSDEAVESAKELATLPRHGQAQHASRNKLPADGDEQPNRLPGVRLITKVLEANEAKELCLDDAVIKTLKWVLGLGAPTAIKGLTACIAEATRPALTSKKQKKAPTNKAGASK